MNWNIPGVCENVGREFWKMVRVRGAEGEAGENLSPPRLEYGQLPVRLQDARGRRDAMAGAVSRCGGRSAMAPRLLPRFDFFDFKIKRQIHPIVHLALLLRLAAHRVHRPRRAGQSGSRAGASTVRTMETRQRQTLLRTIVGRRSDQEAARRRFRAGRPIRPVARSSSDSSHDAIR